jgi:hypothetical protein
VDYLYIQALDSITEGIKEVRLNKKKGSSTKHSSLNSKVQYGIVEYKTHRLAALARRCLIPNRIVLWGKQISVDWAIPRSFHQVSSSFPITKLQIMI